MQRRACPQGMLQHRPICLLGHNDGDSCFVDLVCVCMCRENGTTAPQLQMLHTCARCMAATATLFGNGRILRGLHGWPPEKHSTHHSSWKV
eukprot:4234448-Amphidinium_carterae.1